MRPAPVLTHRTEGGLDLPLLVSNLTGCERKDWTGEHDRELAARVVENLVYLIAEVSPGAKKGSTAPYTRAELVLVEAGDRQPRTLANAFRDAVPLVDRVVADGLADQVVADRVHLEVVLGELLALAVDVIRLGEGPVDLEVITPAGDLEPVVAPLGGEPADLVEG